MSGLKTGDVVRYLDTKMTVEQVIDGDVYCKWFVGATLHEGVFASDVLEKVDG